MGIRDSQMLKAVNEAQRSDRQASQFRKNGAILRKRAKRRTQRTPVPSPRGY